MNLERKFDRLQAVRNRLLTKKRSKGLTERDAQRLERAHRQIADMAAEITPYILRAAAREAKKPRMSENETSL